MIWKRFSAFLTFALLLALVGCSGEQSPSYRTIADPAEADQILQRLLGQPKFNLSTVHVARFSLDGNETEVTSLLPAFYRGYKAIVRGFKLRPGQSFTLVAFNADRTELEFFTRDASTAATYHQVFPIATIDAGLTLEFPLAHEDGAVKPAVVQFAEHKSR